MGRDKVTPIFEYRLFLRIISLDSLREFDKISNST